MMKDAFLEEFGLNRSQKNIVKKYIRELQYSFQFPKSL